MTKKIFITSIGHGNYNGTEYYLETNKDIKHKTKFASVAVKNLIHGLKDAETYVFSTLEAIEKYEDELKKEMDCTCYNIQQLRSQTDFWDVFHKISKHIPEEADLYLDITSAFRSLPFVIFGVIQYLTALKKVEIKGIYYGVYENKETTPILDLISMKEMIDWFYAAEIFKNYGVSHLMAKNFRKLQAKIYAQTKKAVNFKGFGNLFDDVSYAISNTDTLHLAKTAKSLLDTRKEIKEELQQYLPVAENLIDKMFNLYKEFTHKDQTEPKLDKTELNREKKIIDWYIDHNQFNNALTLINEWIINKAIVAKGKQEDWLNYSAVRDPIGKELKDISRLGSRAKDEEFQWMAKYFPQDIREVMSAITKVSDLRNKLSHGGYNSDNLKYQGLKNKINDLWKIICTISDDMIKRILTRPIAFERLIITPLGKSPGILYTLLSNEQIVKKTIKLIIITSDDCKQYIKNCFQKLGITYPIEDIIVLNDPWTEIKDPKELTNRYLPILMLAGKVLVNYTGGTSMMQINAHQFNTLAQRYSIPTEKCITIDKRSPEEQRANPYVKGEVRFID